eukprot:GHVP01040991.1.p1 GENE.GHVP01040991.1~~GHVP01040991.1.p1  ORF type:complete len:196 (-),score=33.83 GHVP01040991.1:242-829(-)
MIENFAQFATASTAFALIPNFSEEFEANMNSGPQEADLYKAVSSEETASESGISSLSTSSGNNNAKARYAKGCCCWRARDKEIPLGETTQVAVRYTKRTTFHYGARKGPRNFVHNTTLLPVLIEERESGGSSESLDSPVEKAVVGVATNNLKASPSAPASSVVKSGTRASDEAYPLFDEEIGLGGTAGDSSCSIL